MKLKILGISLIIISIASILYLKETSYNIYQKDIEKNFINGKPNKTDYIGYIEIKSVGIKKGIVKGINDEVLNNNDIGMIRDNNIILAGHAIPEVFGKLNNISVMDKIKIYLYDQIYSYTVYKIIIVDKNNVDYLNEDLVLITCTNDDKRLLILAKKDI